MWVKSKWFLSLKVRPDGLAYAWYEDDVMMDYDYYLRGKVMSDWEFISDMPEFLYSRIDRIKPDFVIMELERDDQFQDLLSELPHRILSTCAVPGIPLMIIPKTEWRRLSCPRGEQLPDGEEEIKKWCISKARDLCSVDLGIEPDLPDIVADAILIGQAYINESDEILKLSTSPYTIPPHEGILGFAVFDESYL